jgi:hypothetical protein
MGTPAARNAARTYASARPRNGSDGARELPMRVVVINGKASMTPFKVLYE